MALSKSQVDTLIIIERTTACISICSTLILLTTFITTKQLRTLSNTLIFYASFANLFANVAALIGGSALSHPNSTLCQFQGFLLEMFMQSDPFWSCAMAINVYLVFFHRFDAVRLKKLFWLYGLICYGLPFIPAIFCLFYSSKNKGKMYGNATLWCWIDTRYATVRISSYYAPIWLAILIALLIYLLVGLQIFKHRSQLNQAHQNNLSSLSSIPPYISHPFAGTKTTHVEVVSHQPPQPTFVPGERSGVGRYSINITSLPFHPGGGIFLRSKNKQKIPTSNMDKIKYAYTRVALLFCISILITWVPASINRVYGLRHPDNPSFGLNAASAVVLPLQGFWNTVIYFVTSLGIWRGLVEGWREKRSLGKGRGRGRGKEREVEIMHLGRVDYVDADGLESEGDGDKDGDSTVGLSERSERTSTEPV